MTDEKLRAHVADMIKQVFEQSCPVDIALINLKQVKHTFSKQNTDFCNAIYPAVLGYTAQHLFVPGSKQKEKTAVLDEILSDKF